MSNRKLSTRNNEADSTSKKIAKLYLYVLGGVFLMLFFLGACYLESASEHSEVHGIWNNIKIGVNSPKLYLHFMIHFASAIAIGFIVIMLLKKLNELDFVQAMQNVKDDIAQLNDKVEHVLKEPGKLQFTNLVKGLHLAKYHLSNSEFSEILVIGTGKDEVQDKYSIVKEYWNETERILSERHVGIKYRRITTASISKTFETHLKTILNTNKGDKNAKVILMDNFAIANTFLIVGNKFLFISPTSLDEDQNAVMDHCFCTEDADIIREYHKHFYAVWEMAKPQGEISTETQFDAALLKKKSITS